MLKKFFRNSLVFLLAVGLSFGLFFLYLNPINLVAILADKISRAAEISNSASVPSNPVNQIALQLDLREKELNARDAAFENRINVLEKQNSLWRENLSLLILAVLIFLFFLVLLNFYFDAKRRKELKKLEEGRKMV